MSEDIKQLLKMFRPNDYVIELGRNRTLPESHADFGLGWVEESVHKYIPHAKLVHPLIASGTLGGFGDEFDWWRAHHKLHQEIGFQIAYAQTKELEASCFALAKRAHYTNWNGLILPGERIGLIIVDFNFTSHSAGTQYRLLFDRSISSHEALNICFRDPDTGRSPHVSSDDVALIDNLRDAVQRVAREILNRVDLAVARSDEALALSRGYKKPNPNHRSYSQSAIIHFAITHEFGHYLHSIGSTNEVAARSRELSLAAVGETPNHQDSDFLEEVFCDYIAMDNCITQMLRFDVPPVFTIIGTLWILHYANARIENTKPSLGEKAVALIARRRELLCRYWGMRFPQDGGELLEDVAVSLNQQLSQLSKLTARLLLPSTL